MTPHQPHQEARLTNVELVRAIERATYWVRSTTINELRNAWQAHLDSLLASQRKRAEIDGAIQSD